MGSFTTLCPFMRRSIGVYVPESSLFVGIVAIRSGSFHYTCANGAAFSTTPGIPRVSFRARFSETTVITSATLLGCRGMKFLSAVGLVRDSSVRKFFVPDFDRDASYSKLSMEDYKAFSSKLSNPQSQVLWAAISHSRDELTSREEETEHKGHRDAMDRAAEISAVANYTTDWLGVYTPEAVEGSATAVLFPHSTEEVQRILKYCSGRRLAVCVQGGNTGLVGGSVPVYDEVVLSLTKMNKIISFDAETGVLVVEAGCLVSEVEAFLESFSQTRPHTKRYESCNEDPMERSEDAAAEAAKFRFPAYIYPLDLASKGSCCVGGTVATAAGGNRYLRYGGAHTHVLGIEAVTGDGRLLQQLNTNQKNNESIHLHHLLIGSEGTLAVITKVAIQCVPAPRSTTVTLLQISGSFDQLRRVCIKAKESLSDILSALEFFDEMCMTLTTRATGLAHPFSRTSYCSHEGCSPLPHSPSQLVKTPRRFYLLLETHGQCAESDSQRVQAFAEQLQEHDVIDDAIFALAEKQKADTWRLREDIAVASSSNCFKVLKFDVSLEVAHMYRPVELINTLLAQGRLEGDFESLLQHGEMSLQRHQIEESRESLPAIAIGYGHIGDGNIHINVLVQDCATAEEVNRIQRFCDTLVYGFVRKHKGSISAEHGVGVLKAAEVPGLRGPEFMELLKGVKRCFDPQGILNPYKGWRMSDSSVNSRSLQGEAMPDCTISRSKTGTVIHKTRMA